MMKLAEEMSALLGTKVKPGEYGTVFWELNVQGKMDIKLLHRIIVLLCKKIEELEDNRLKLPLQPHK